MDRIFIEDLCFDCIIGILDFEREHEQPIKVSVDLELDLKNCGYSGDLDKTINYAALSQDIKEYIISRRARLLEELGVELCDRILEKYRPCAVTVRLSKPKAVAQAREVGVQITKRLELD